MASSAQDPEGARPRARGRLLKLAALSVAGVAAVVGLYAALGFWVAPKFIRSQVVELVAEKYGRKASLGEVRLNPFTFKLEASDFSLPDADGTQMIAFERLGVDFSIASVWRDGFAFNEIRLDAPRVRLVRRTDGRLNIEDLIPPKKEDEPPSKIFVDHLEVRRGRAEVADLARRQPFAKTFTPIGFTLKNFSTVQDDGSYVLNARSERGEGLAWRGTLGLNPLASRGTFAIARAQVRPLWELAREAVPFEVTGGELGLSGRYRFAMKGETPELGVEVDQAKLVGTGLRAPGAATDWITLPEVAVSKVSVDATKRSVTVGLIEATGPEVTAWTEKGGGLNLARFAPAPAPAKAQSEAAPGAAGEPAWKVALPELRVRGAKIDFEERSTGKPVRIIASPLDLSVKGLALPLAAPLAVEASAGLDGGGRAAAKGLVTLEDEIAAELDVEATQLDLVRLQPYVEQSAALKLRSGTASAKGHVSYVAGGAARFDGAAQIDRLHTVDAILDEDFVNWTSLRLEGVSVRSQPLAVKVREVTALEPYAKVVIGPNYLMNITTVLDPKGAAQRAAAAPPPQPKPKAGLFKRTAKAPPPPPPPAPAREPLPVEIALVRVKGGRMDFADLSIQPNFAAGIQSLDGTIKGLSGRQDARADVDLTGQVDRFSPVKIEGEVNYFAARSYTDLAMSFQNMEMTTFTPYSGKFAGYRINKGKLNVDLKYHVDDQKLDADHRVVINQLELGEKVESDDAVKLPVKLIVALLKDRHGVIDIPIAISGTLDDPKFRIWPVIWKVVGNLMVKVATSPFALLGALAGGGEDLQHIGFAPGAAALDTAGQEQVASLGKALAERPALNLEIPMSVNAGLDKAALVEARLGAQLTAAASERLGRRAKPGAAEAALAEPKTRHAILEDLYRGQFGAKPEFPETDGGKDEVRAAEIAWLEERLRSRIAVSEDELLNLGRARAEAVQAALLEGGAIEASRVFITASQPSEAKDGAVEMALSLS